MPLTPYIPDNNLLNIEILLNGENKGLHTFLKKVNVHFELNKIPYAKLSFISSNPDVNADEKNKLESDTIHVRDEIEIKVTIDDDSKTLFKGIVFKMEKKLDPTSGFETKIECKDICIDLMSNQEFVDNETFEDRMNRFLQLVSITNEVSLGSCGNEIITQTHNTKPWDYLLSYLDSLGQMSTVKNGVFSVSDITTEDIEVKYIAKNGVNIFEFEGKEEEADTTTGVVVQYWNPATQSVETQENDADSETAQNREVISVSQSNYTSKTINQISKARATKNKWKRFNGKVKTYGNLEVSYGEYLMFEKVNEKIDKKPILIAAEHHTIENGCWQTEYNFGLENSNTFVENISNTSTTNESIMGQTNSMQGLQIGIVTQIEDDLENEFRIRVRIPTISEEGDGVWARLSSLQAGSGRGGFFIPEVGDEVVLGCFNNNPDTPVILGKLYSSSYPPPFDIEQENYIQGIVSKEETKFIINDEDKSVEISTASGNKLLISDDEKGIVLEDQNGNKIQLNNDGITLDSTKDIVLKAVGNIEIEGLQNTLKASTTMELKGAMIKLN